MKALWLDEIARYPTRFLEWPLYLVQLFGGLVVLSPAFHPEQAPNGNLAAAGNETALKIYGVILVLIGIAGLVGRFYRDRLWIKSKFFLQLSKAAAFGSFFLFLYFTILRILIMGATNLGWTTFALNAVMVAVIYLHLRWID